MGSYEAQRLLDLNNESPIEPPVPPLPNLDGPSQQVFDAVEKTWKPQQQQPGANSHLTRTDSELSLCTTMRRRSLVQTPGVATRAQPSPQVSVSAKSSFRKSLPATPSQSRHNSIESSVARRLTMPNPAPYLTFEPPEIMATSNDGEYRQLGVIKFGSLRIINGAPSPSPGPENDDEDEGMITPRNQSFDKNRAKAVEIEVATSEELAIAHPMPIFKVSSPIAKGFEKSASSPILQVDIPPRAARVDGADTLSHPQPGPFSPDLQMRSKHTADEAVACVSTAEVLHVRNDPSAKPSPETIQERAQQDKAALNRSDSGCVSTPFSEASRKPLSKADSGYSSNVSLRSLLGSKSGSRKGRNSPEKLSPDQLQPSSSSILTSSTLEKPEEEEEAAEGSASEKAPTPPPKNNASETPTRNSMSSTSRGSIRMPSLRSSAKEDHTQDPQTPRPIHRRAVSADSVAAITPSPAKSMSALDIGNGTHRAKLQRFLSGSRRKNSVKKEKEPAKEEEVPSLPVDKDEKIQRYDNGTYFIASKRPHLRVHPSRDTLKTILSVGSTDLLQSEEVLQDAEKETKKEEEATPGPAPKPKTPRRRSFQQNSHSFNHAASSVASPRRQASLAILNRKRSVTMAANHRRDLQGLNSSAPEHILEYEAAMTSVDSVRQSMGKSAFDQAITANERASAPPRPIIHSSSVMDRRRGPPLPPLRTRASAPTFRGTTLQPMSPLVPEPGKKPKSPPPVSMQTRGSKKSKSHRPAPPRRPKSTPPGGVPREQRPPLPRHSSRESIHSYPPAQNMGHSLNASLSSPTGYYQPMHQVHRTASWQPGPGFQGSARPRRGSVTHPVNIGPANSGMNRSQSTVPYPKAHQNQNPRHSRTDGYGLSHQWPLQQGAHGFTSHGNNHMVDHHHYQHHHHQQQHGQNPHVSSHGHVRRESGGPQSPHGHNPPYRVLHSYNSPAYKGVPIWS